MAKALVMLMYAVVHAHDHAAHPRKGATKGVITGFMQKCSLAYCPAGPLGSAGPRYVRYAPRGSTLGADNSRTRQMLIRRVARSIVGVLIAVVRPPRA